MIFGPEVREDFLYALPIEAGANLITIPMGHAMDALCWVLGEVKDISATLVNHRKELQLIDHGKKPVKKVPKTAHDYATFTALLVDGGGVVNVTYAPGGSRTGRDFVWEINGTEGSLILENNQSGHVQMFQPTVKLATGDGELEEVEVEKAPDYSYNVGKAWDAWAGVGLDKGHTATTFEDALLRHKMIDAIYRSAESGTRTHYL